MSHFKRSQRKYVKKTYRVRKSHVGTLDKVLDMAADNDWIIVDMKRDWKRVFPSEK